METRVQIIGLSADQRYSKSGGDQSQEIVNDLEVLFGFYNNLMSEAIDQGTSNSF
jgi:hypothetical protein